MRPGYVAISDDTMTLLLCFTPDPTHTDLADGYDEQCIKTLNSLTEEHLRSPDFHATVTFLFCLAPQKYASPLAVSCHLHCYQALGLWHASLGDLMMRWSSWCFVCPIT